MLSARAMSEMSASSMETRIWCPLATVSSATQSRPAPLSAKVSTSPLSTLMLTPVDWLACSTVFTRVRSIRVSSEKVSGASESTITRTMRPCLVSGKVKPVSR